MKNYFIKSIIIFIGLFLSQSIIAQSDTIKIITYNIMNGFDWGKDTVRQINNANWINSQKPDVVALQELCDYTPERLQKEATQWGHNYSVLLKTSGYSVGLTSNKPIQVVEKQTNDLWHGMLHCETWGIDFFVIHLSPFDYNFRFNEANIIINKLKTNALNPEKCIVLGDFNSHSPFDDDIYKSRKEVLSNYQKAEKQDSKNHNTKNHNLRDMYFDYSVMGCFLSAPLIDVCQKYIVPERRYSFPTPILIGKWYTAESSENRKERIDYIMVTPKLAVDCVNAIIWNNFETALLSDHYPTVAKFVLRK